MLLFRPSELLLGSEVDPTFGARGAFLFVLLCGFFRPLSIDALNWFGPSIAGFAKVGNSVEGGRCVGLFSFFFVLLDPKLNCNINIQIEHGLDSPRSACRIRQAFGRFYISGTPDSKQ